MKILCFTQSISLFLRWKKWPSEYNTTCFLLCLQTHPGARPRATTWTWRAETASRATITVTATCTPPATKRWLTAARWPGNPTGTAPPPPTTARTTSSTPPAPATILHHPRRLQPEGATQSSKLLHPLCRLRARVQSKYVPRTAGHLHAHPLAVRAGPESRRESRGSGWFPRSVAPLPRVGPAENGRAVVRAVSRRERVRHAPRRHSQFPTRHERLMATRRVPETTGNRMHAKKSPSTFVLKTFLFECCSHITDHREEETRQWTYGFSRGGGGQGGRISCHSNTDSLEKFYV